MHLICTELICVEDIAGLVHADITRFMQGMCPDLPRLCASGLISYLISPASLAVMHVIFTYLYVSITVTGLGRDATTRGRDVSRC